MKSYILAGNSGSFHSSNPDYYKKALNGYANSPPQYGYNHAPDMRQNNYYSSHPYPYDAYHSSYHHRGEHYAADAMYRSKTNFMPRDSMPYQYPGSRDYSYYGGAGGGGAGIPTREFYGAQQPPLPTAANGESSMGGHHHNGYGTTYPEYNQSQTSTTSYPTSPNGYPPMPTLNNATGLSNNKFY